MIILDASAMLALLFDEPGAEVVRQHLEEGQAVIGSVNLAEVTARLLDRGLSEAEADDACQACRLGVLPFTHEQALLSGKLRPSTRSLGLSLGDRCCLALALTHPGATVATSDRAWKSLQRFDVRLIR